MASDAVNPKHVIAQMERILESRELAGAPSLSRFLRYIVEETLAGRGDSLKEYTIGSGVFGRGESFAPRTDPIVRVQARNLRARLAHYYAGPGAGDPLRIEVPKGTYVPVFIPVAAPGRRKWLVSAMMAVAALLVLVGAAMIEAHRLTAHHEPQPGRQYLAP